MGQRFESVLVFFFGTSQFVPNYIYLPAGRTANPKTKATAKPKGGAPKVKGPLGLELANKTLEQKTTALRALLSNLYRCFFQPSFVACPGNELKKELGAIAGLQLECGCHDQLKDHCSALKKFSPPIQTLFGRQVLL